ncbi:MAG: glucose-1-phosphate adenylyltransferase [Candidatus Omnitrophica bacterium]|nr:glucose-1-phosphate adenylyltransferase [Candidatus Omnitrophota bacterium]MBU4478704.1 glucose-1-phosphate adenylyltransferase [Candidatus Omnitrophota bacterium]MCG2703163.1 glucose-1-phosphate adenylyltransferase [Candidatus Omnitrophota bacterium]
MKNPDCLVLILGGGRGTRLFPLTLERSKPAIGFGGKYRLIDIPVSNCINSGYNKIFVLTQFLSASLHGHIMHTYRFDNFSKGFVEILSAEQSHKSSSWFEGTADAVRHVLRHLRYMPQEYVLILSGDHLYKMDYREMMSFHVKNNADVTIASIAVDEKEASRMGVLDCAASGRLKRIVEKPENPARLRVKARTIKGAGKSAKYYNASMGIYLFKKDVLFDILTKTKTADFGKHILPMLVKKDRRVYSFEFHGYWRDVGTISSYYEASMDLLGETPKFNLFDEGAALVTRARFLPPTKIADSHLVNSLIADGCQIRKAVIENSVIGLRSRIMDNTTIKDSIVIGNDYYQARSEGKMSRPHIGEGVIIERAIVDKNVTIGSFCQITDKRNAADRDGDLYYIRDGITIIRRGVVMPPHMVI